MSQRCNLSAVLRRVTGLAVDGLGTLLLAGRSLIYGIFRIPLMNMFLLVIQLHKAIQRRLHRCCQFIDLRLGLHIRLFALIRVYSLVQNL